MSEEQKTAMSTPSSQPSPTLPPPFLEIFPAPLSSDNELKKLQAIIARQKATIQQQAEKITQLSRINDLLKAIEENDRDKLIRAITEGVDINHRYSNQQTALMKAAAICCNPSAVFILLKYGAKVSLKDNTGQTVLSLFLKNRLKASHFTREERSILHSLFNSKQNFDADYDLIFGGEWNLLQELISQLRHIKKRESNRNLIEAILGLDLSKKNIALSQAFFDEFEYRIECRDEGVTRRIFNLMISVAGVNFQLPQTGFTALMTASRAGREDFVKALLERKADVNLKNHKGMTALDLSTKDSIKQLLLKSDQNVNATPKPLSSSQPLVVMGKKPLADTARLLPSSQTRSQPKTAIKEPDGAASRTVPS